MKERLIEVIAYFDKGNQKRFADRIKMQYVQLNQYVTGKRPIGKAIKAALSKLGVSMDWFDSGLGTMLTGNLENKANALLVPWVSTVSCGEPVANWDGYGEKYISFEIDRKLNHPVAVTARGHSMEEFIMDGGKVIFEDVPDELIKDGDIVLVNLVTVPDTKEGLIKFVRFDKKKRQIILWSKNSKHPALVYDQDEIFKLYKFVGLNRVYKSKR